MKRLADTLAAHPLTFDHQAATLIRPKATVAERFRQNSECLHCSYSETAPYKALCTPWSTWMA